MSIQQTKGVNVLKKIFLEHLRIRFKENMKNLINSFQPKLDMEQKHIFIFFQS